MNMLFKIINTGERKTYNARQDMLYDFSVVFWALNFFHILLCAIFDMINSET